MIDDDMCVPYYELDNSYASGFDDARQKALDIVHKWIYGPYKEKDQELARKIYTDLEENM